jgi:hypothetical protein
MQRSNIYITYAYNVQCFPLSVSYTSLILWEGRRNFLLSVSERIFGPQREAKTQEHMYTLVLRIPLNFAALNG